MSASVLPARAGMSPVGVVDACLSIGAPRTGGDEPQLLTRLLKLTKCSPHGRG